MSDSDYTPSLPDTAQHEVREGRHKFTMIYHDDLVAIAEIGPSALMVYTFLAKYANYSNGTAFPSIDTLATDCNLSRNTVMKAIKDLEAIKLLTVRKKQTPHGFKQSIYTVMSKIDTPQSKISTEPSSKFGPSSVQNLDYNDNQVNKTQVNENLPASKIQKSMPRNGMAQTLLATLHEDVLHTPPPTNYGRAMKDADTLAKAGCTPEEIQGIAEWLLADPFWGPKGVTINRVLARRDEWLSSRKHTPSRSSQFNDPQKYSREQVMLDIANMKAGR